MADADIIRLWDAERTRLKSKLIAKNTESWQSDHDFPELKFVAGVDLSFIIGDDINACAGYVVCRRAQDGSIDVVYEAMEMIKLTAPYIPGYLAFREAEPLTDVINNQRRTHPELTPQAIIVDGNGILHTHQFGLACHLGVLLDLPTIGVAKNLFQMNDEGLLRDEDHARHIQALNNPGDFFNLNAADGTVLGIALKTSPQSKKPVFVSCGHRIDLDTCRKVVMLYSRHRIPEPTRQADIRSRVVARKFERDKEDASRK